MAVHQLDQIAGDPQPRFGPLLSRLHVRLRAEDDRGHRRDPHADVDPAGTPESDHHRNDDELDHRERREKAARDDQRLERLRLADPPHRNAHAGEPDLIGLEA